MNYWEECIKEAFEDADITATDEQVNNVIGWVEGSFENYGLATGAECILNPLESEISDLKRTIKRMEDNNFEDNRQSDKRLARVVGDKNHTIYELQKQLEELRE